MKIKLTTLTQVGLLLIAALIAVPAITLAQGSSDMEILRQKVKADKKLLVSQNMSLTEAEAKAFWPIYEAYQNDLKGINERLAKVIVDYAEAYSKGPVMDDQAKKLLNDALSVEESELKLKQSYVTKLGKAIPGSKVTRYIQIENKIRAALRYELAAQIPLVD